jgi:hypothetical protein
MQALVDEETVVKMMNYAYKAYNLKDPKMEAEFLHSQVYVMQAEHSVCVCVSVCVCMRQT